MATEWTCRDVTEAVYHQVPDDHVLKPLIKMLADCYRFNTSKEDVQGWFTEHDFDFYQEIEDVDEYFVEVTKSFQEGLACINVTWSYECAISVSVTPELLDKDCTVTVLRNVPTLTPSE